jgi:hypothetical protein
MRYITVCDDLTRFHWEVEVLIGNFKSVGISPSKIEIVLLHNGRPSDKSLELQKKHPDVKLFWYIDTRPDKLYVASKKPWGMYLHLQAHPQTEEAIFYHDTDIAFTKKINEDFFQNHGDWWGSNCEGYIGYDYVYGKGEAQYLQMCKIVGIPDEFVRFNMGIGAQYIIKNSTPSYWLKVYEDSNKLYKYLMDNNKGVEYPIQIWTAEMWATLWVAWQFGHRTKIHEDLNFVMATNGRQEIEKVKIFHNAGVTNELKDKMFYKGEYFSKYPTNLPEYNQTYASAWYVEQIRKYVS